MSEHNRHHSGNVLFIILLGISLFVALSYAVTRSNRGGANMSLSDATFAANEIMRYGQQLEDAVNVLMSNGVRVEDVSFENSVEGGYDHASSVDANMVFNDAGGGMTYVAPDAAWLDSTYSAQSTYGMWFFPADICADTIGTGTGAGCATDSVGTGEDMMVVLPYIRYEICAAINRRLGIAECGGTICETDADMDTYPEVKFQGTFQDGAVFGVSTGEYDHRTEGCIRPKSGGAPGIEVYHYYKILVAR